MTELTYRDQLAELPPTVMYTLLGISPEDVLEQKNYFSSGATAEEIIVLRAADQAAAGRLSEALTARLAAQKATYASYAPAEVLYLDGAALAVKREYLAFCVAEDGEAAAALIQSALGE
ncbi:MAG: DUF4358 domain-containing protein [Peptococcaceae bacterium]|nr:DUF4358 domain-containing protein [Peptococcaceae bacterium]